MTTYLASISKELQDQIIFYLDNDSLLRLDQIIPIKWKSMLSNFDDIDENININKIIRINWNYDSNSKYYKVIFLRLDKAYKQTKKIMNDYLRRNERFNIDIKYITNIELFLTHEERWNENILQELESSLITDKKLECDILLGPLDSGIVAVEYDEYMTTVFFMGKYLLNFLVHYIYNAM